MSTLDFYTATLLNLYEQRLHCTANDYARELLGIEPRPCDICGLPLTQNGRVWKEGDEAPKLFLKADPKKFVGSYGAGE